MMAEGRVRVNGRVVRELGTRVDPARDVVEVDGRRVAPRAPAWVALHKPSGVLTTRGDPHGGRTVYDVLPPEARGLTYVGRLDRDTEGLLLFTNEGQVAHRLLLPATEVEREYRARVQGVPGSAEVRALTSGVALDDGVARARRVRVSRVGRDEADVTLVLTEGRKREVRRMLGAVGHPARRLVRVRFGPIRLGELPRGAWRALTGEEVESLRAAARQPDVHEQRDETHGSER